MNSTFNLPLAGCCVAGLAAGAAVLAAVAAGALPAPRPTAAGAAAGAAAGFTAAVVAPASEVTAGLDFAASAFCISCHHF